MNVIEYNEKYDEQIKLLLDELQEHIVNIDKEKFNIKKENYKEEYFKKTKEEIIKYQGKMLLLEDNENILGLIVGVINNEEIDTYDFKCPKRGRITELVIKKTIRGKGLGKILLNSMEDYLKKEGCKNILISVFGYNDKAISFYEKNKYHTRLIEMIKEIDNTKYELKELSLEIIDEIYEMYQDIPDGDNNQSNKAYGLNKEDFKKYIEKEIKRKYNEVTDDDTPTLTYIMYVDNIPVGYICLRTKLNDNWKKWSGNFYYQIRKSKRRMGYATKMLGLGLQKLKEMNFEVAYGQSSKGNIASQKTIENNKGIFLREDDGTRYYKIVLEEK